MAPAPAAAAGSTRTAVEKKRNDENDRTGNHAAGEDVHGDQSIPRVFRWEKPRLVIHLTNKGECPRKLSVADKRHDFVRVL